MKFTLAASIQALYALIGLGLTLHSDIPSDLSRLASFVLFALIPAYGAYGTYFRRPGGILVSLIFFISQSIRRVSPDSFVPDVMPITVSFPIGDFSDGQGYLVDVFALFMAIFLAWLLKSVSDPEARTCNG